MRIRLTQKQLWIKESSSISKERITEKFINVEFLVPFPRYNFTIRQQVETLLNELSKKWITQSEFCNMTSSTTYRNQTQAFNVDWLYTEILNETIEAEIEVLKLRNETEKLLTKVEEDSHNRQKRAAPLAIAAAVAGIGLFGPGIAMSSGGCGGITGIFGSCQRSSQNAEKIDRLANSFNSLNDYVMEIGAQTDEKFFLVADELAKVYKVQNEMQDNQNRNWKLVIPMPQKDSVDALRYVIEGEYLAISEGQMETTVLTKAQYDNCLGSPRYRICHETMETHIGFSSCLATLKFHHTISALKVCDTEKVVLPNPERAQNLGYGIWLLTSASSDYTLSEVGTDENGRHTNIPHKGCNLFNHIKMWTYNVQ